MTRAQAPTRGWRSRELFLLVFPVVAVLLAADAIGGRPSAERTSAWLWFAAASGVAAIVGTLYGARSALREGDPAARRLSTGLATTAALIGVVVFRFVGGLPRVVTLGIVSAFILSAVIVRACRALIAHPPDADPARLDPPGMDRQVQA